MKALRYLNICDGWVDQWIVVMLLKCYVSKREGDSLSGWVDFDWMINPYPTNVENRVSS